MKKIFCLVAFIIFANIFASNVHAEIKTYTGVGEYVMSDFENPDVAKQRAKARALQNAQEQAGVFVSSYTKIINHVVKEDEIITIASSVLKEIDVDFEREFLQGDDGILYRATVKATIDTDDINKWLEKSSEQRAQLVAQVTELQKANAEQDKQIAELKNQIANVKTQADKEKLTQEFSAEDKIFLSNKKLEEAGRFFEKDDYNSAINLCNQAIELNPNNEFAYILRGAFYEIFQNYQQAISDYNQAIKLNPNFAEAYNNRGVAYSDLKNYSQTISDFTQAIKLSPNAAYAYNNFPTNAARE